MDNHRQLDGYITKDMKINRNQTKINKNSKDQEPFSRGPLSLTVNIVPTKLSS